MNACTDVTANRSPVCFHSLLLARSASPKNTVADSGFFARRTAAISLVMDVVDALGQ